jgi:hypothetical protein
MIQSHRSLSNLLESLIPSFVFSHLPCRSCWQVPVGLSASLAHTFHTVEMAARMQLMAQGQVAACVPFATKSRIKMTLYKGEAVLAARREVASKLTHALIAALKRPRRVDKPDWAPMQQLSDAGFKSDPISGLPVFDPSACTPALLESVWRSYCGVADTINTKELGGTGAALEGHRPGHRPNPTG